MEDLEFLCKSSLDMAKETEDKVLDEATLRKGIEHCIFNPKYGCFYIAQDGVGVPLGMLMNTYECSVQVGGQIVWIQSVFVLQQARRQGVFRALYNKVVEDAKANPKTVCVRLYVDTTNESAKSTYKALGMA